MSPITRDGRAHIALLGGVFRMGSDAPAAYPDDGEGPVHDVCLSPFAIAPTTVTNAEFAAFADDTGFLTDAERFGWSFVFAGHVGDEPTAGVVGTPWWRQVEGADWRHPFGRTSTWTRLADHPVVHVSWADARAFCQWAGCRLPTEAEWEFAARGGLEGATFPWGDEREPSGRHLMNVFQGSFPDLDTAADGFAGTAPVRSFPPNGYGLFETTGNVWEWCNDWFSAGYYSRSPEHDPPGEAIGLQRVMRGGSYLCHDSYCRRYRVSARSSNTPDSSCGNIGFRTALDLP